jgi:putative ABC transport system permease protein
MGVKGKMNKQRFLFKMMTSSLIRRRSRMITALLAVAIGATILSGLVTVSYDIPRQMGQEFRSYGANLVLVPAGNESVLSLDTVRRAASYLPAEDVIGMAPYRYSMAKINEQPFMAAGTDLAEARKTSPYWYVSGRWPEIAGEALVGAEVAEVIRLVPGNSFTITGTIPGGEGKSFSRDFSVAGIVQTGGAEEAFIFMSLSDLEAMTTETGVVDVVECSIAVSGDALEALAERISVNVAGVSPRRVLRLTESEGAVLTKLQALVYLVTVIVLLLIMICVATTMMAVVAERRREIGLKKALGAANLSVAAEFLGEGAFLGGAGGLLGAIFGFIFAQAVALNVFSRSISFRPVVLPLTIIASIIVTSLACLIPVRSAAEVDPAVVLRGE